MSKNRYKPVSRKDFHRSPIIFSSRRRHTRCQSDWSSDVCSSDLVNSGVDDNGLPIPSATNNTINPPQQYIIQSYLNGGGAFFMSAMSILSQLGDVPFRQNVLQVAGFAENPDPPAPCSDCDEDFGVPAILGGL